MKITKVQDKKTKEIFSAEYAANLRGNKRYWVNGRFYSDKDFDKKFNILSSSII